MKRKLLILLLVALLLLPAFGCKTKKANPEDSVVGTWQDRYGFTKYQFTSNGKMKMEALNHGFKGTYQVDGDKITIQYHVLMKDVNDTYTLKLDGDTMYLNDDKFTRKK
jgi:uncharacterized protein (TIGR03066 family)